MINNNLYTKFIVPCSSNYRDRRHFTILNRLSHCNLSSLLFLSVPNKIYPLMYICTMVTGYKKANKARHIVNGKCNSRILWRATLMAMAMAMAMAQKCFISTQLAERFEQLEHYWNNGAGRWRWWCTPHDENDDDDDDSGAQGGVA